MKYWYNNQWNELTLNALDGMPIGSIIQFAGSVIPTGWLICDGSSLSEEEYPQLYDVIGHTYGGSGLSFNLPNFKGKVSVGRDTSDTNFDTLGETGGEKTHTLTVQEMPVHNHWGIYNESLTSERLGGWGNGSHSGILSEMATNTFDHLRTGNTGEDQPHNNLQPYLVVNYIIKATQTTPTFASVVNANSNSTTDSYSCDYSNEHYGGVVLYNNASGTSQTINLSDDVSNYNHFVIVYKNSDWNEYYTHIKYDTSSDITISGIHVFDVNKDLYTFKLTMSGTTISWVSSYFSTNNAAPFVYNPFKIVKVIGYK